MPNRILQKPERWIRGRASFLLILLGTTVVSAQVPWGVDMRLTNDPAESYTSYNNAWCVADSGEVIHVVWYDNRDGNNEIYYKRSLDNGASWEPDVRLTNNPYQSEYPAVAAFGENIHVVWQQDTSEGIWDIYYRRSLDNGVTWGDDINLTLTEEGCFYPSVAACGSNVHVVWEDYRDDFDAEIYYKHSTDDGANWGADTRLTNHPHASRYPSVATVGFDRVHVVWQDSSYGAPWCIQYINSFDTGNNWGSIQTISDSLGDSRHPSVAAQGDDIHVAWHDFRDYPEYEIFYRRSLDDGAVWQPEAQLTDHSLAMHPSVAAFGDDIHLVWEDSTYFIFYKHSRDTGQTWGADTQIVTNPSFSIRPSISVAYDKLHVVWTDNRDGNYEIYYEGSSYDTASAVHIEEYLPSVLDDCFLEVSGAPSVIRYHLPRAGKVSLVITDVAGRLVQTLVDERKQEGYHTVFWDGLDTEGQKVAIGVYFCTLQSDDFNRVKKTVQIR